MICPIKISTKEFKEDLDSGFITTEFPIKDLVKDAIIREEYEDEVIVEVYNFNYDTIRVRLNIKDFLTPKEHYEVLKLNGYE